MEFGVAALFEAGLDGEGTGGAGGDEDVAHWSVEDMGIGRDVVRWSMWCFWKCKDGQADRD
jgi:hypothetical protein